MQVSNPNNIKIYNLSAGKSLPEWLSDRKKRSLQKQDADVRRRIDLLQDFDMPSVSNSVQVSKDGQYIFASGVYKPRIKCYDVSEMSLKFERCLDAVAVRYKLLADDYSKIVFLNDDRTVEFHAQHGRYYRTRIPKFGRDLDYHPATCDMFFVGASSEIYRLNLELGRFLTSLNSSASEIFCCEVNPVHGLLACGTQQGTVECWDPRTKHRAGILDCMMGNVIQDLDMKGIPAVTSLKFRDGLNVAVGTSTGHVMLYDLRSNKPLLVKDHQYGLPIKRIAFHEEQELVLSIDKKILKLWNVNTGKAFTSIEPGTALNDLCLYPNSGLLFLANEAPKILTYYIPALGAAPKWCSFLDNLTEELEENPATQVYDDYKFVTRSELENLGLNHLIGSSLLRAYMHGFFIDIRLYHKAKSISEPFAYEEYRKNKIREKIEEERTNRVKVKKLPKVNRLLAEKLLEQQNEPSKSSKKTSKEAKSLLEDDRFSAMFSNVDFQVDTESAEYRLLNPVVSKIDKNKQKKSLEMLQQFDEIEDEEIEGRPSEEDSSSDDEHTWKDEVKKQHKLLRDEEKDRKRRAYLEKKSKPKFYELKDGEQFSRLDSEKKDKLAYEKTSISLGDRVKGEQDSGTVQRRRNTAGAREMNFSLKKKDKDSKWKKEADLHHAERRKIRRSASELASKKKQTPKFYMGKRVK